MRGSCADELSLLSTAILMFWPVLAVGQRTPLFNETSLKMSAQIGSPSIKSTAAIFATEIKKYKATDEGIVARCVMNGRAILGAGNDRTVLATALGAAGTSKRPPMPTLISSAMSYV